MDYEELEKASRKFTYILTNFVKDFIKAHPTENEIAEFEESGNHICIDYRTLEISVINEADMESEEDDGFYRRHCRRFKNLLVHDLWMYIKKYDTPFSVNWEEVRDIAYDAVETFSRFNGIKDYWSLPPYLLPTKEEIEEEERQKREYMMKQERIRMEKERIKAEHAFKSDAVFKVLVIPDVHGRTFWMDAVEKYPELPVIFLGDYIDPYHNHIESIKSGDALERFRQILKFKHDNPNRVTLLLGNHDLHYFSNIDCSRKDYDSKEEIVKLIEENINDFEIAVTTTVNGKTFLFSHAGVLPGWLDLRFPDIDKSDVIGICNTLNARLREDPDFKNMLVKDASWFRGGPADFGSPVWADVNEHEATEPDTDGELKDYPYVLPGDIMQIFGHTQQKEDPVYRPYFCCLDCRRAFLLTDKGQIMELNEE